MTDDDGDVVSGGDVEYGTFGEYDGGAEGEYSYTGKQRDSGTGLSYFNARYYDPEIGRFITVDPIKSGVNWYVYCGNNPLKFVDPNGLEWFFTLTYSKTTNWGKPYQEVEMMSYMFIANEKDQLDSVMESAIDKGSAVGEQTDNPINIQFQTQDDTTLFEATITPAALKTMFLDLADDEIMVKTWDEEEEKWVEAEWDEETENYIPKESKGSDESEGANSEDENKETGIDPNQGGDEGQDDDSSQDEDSINIPPYPY